VIVKYAYEIVINIQIDGIFEYLVLILNIWNKWNDNKKYWLVYYDVKDKYVRYNLDSDERRRLFLDLGKYTYIRILDINEWWGIFEYWGNAMMHHNNLNCENYNIRLEKFDYEYERIINGFYYHSTRCRVKNCKKCTVILDGAFEINGCLLELKECYKLYDLGKNHIIKNKIKKYEEKCKKEAENAALILEMKEIEEEVEELDRLIEYDSDYKGELDMLSNVPVVVQSVNAGEIWQYMYLKEKKDCRIFWKVNNEEDILHIPVGNFIKFKEKYYYRYDENNIQEYEYYLKELEEKKKKKILKLKILSVNWLGD